MTSSLAIYMISGIATAGVILRPFQWPEAVWAVAGACLLLVFGLLPLEAGLAGVWRAKDVYFFLIGMMLLAEVARKEGLFDWLAHIAVNRAGGSGSRLFLLIYVVGILVTVFLSNDATAVVLTPAVYAAARAARAEPLPFLFICAFIANAASFVLPISNPANLVVYASHMPPLIEWLARFTLPSVLAIGATFLVLRLTQNVELHGNIADEIEPVTLSRTGRVAGLGIIATAAVLLAASAYGLELGVPTFAAGLATTLVVLLLNRGGFVEVMRDVSWSVLPLVGGLFVLVEALEKVGLLTTLAGFLREIAQRSEDSAALGAGMLVAVLCNLVNNLPAGLLAGAAVQASEAPAKLAGAILIGVDLGPNLSVTGSLATILWLVAIRREGQHVGAWRFLKLGLLVMPPALVLALVALILQPG